MADLLVSIGTLVTSVATVVLVIIYRQTNHVLRQQYRPVLVIEESKFDNDILDLKLGNVGLGLARHVRVYGRVRKSKEKTGYFTKSEPTKYSFRRYAYPDTIPGGQSIKLSLPMKYGNTGLGEEGIFYDTKGDRGKNPFTIDGRTLFDFGSVSIQLEKELTEEQKADFRLNWGLVEIRASYTDVEGSNYSELLDEKLFKLGITNLEEAIRWHGAERAMGMAKLMVGKKLTGITQTEFDEIDSQRKQHPANE